MIYAWIEGVRWIADHLRPWERRVLVFIYMGELFGRAKGAGETMIRQHVGWHKWKSPYALHRLCDADSKYEAQLLRYGPVDSTEGYPGGAGIGYSLTTTGRKVAHELYMRELENGQ